MGMFAQSSTADGMTGDAPRRFTGMRERGTRSLLFLVITAVASYLAITKATDSYLLRQQWPPLASDLHGLTVVGTLDSRGDYDRNLFKVKHLNKAARVELTDFGFRSIFNDESPLFTQSSGDAVKQALNVDNVTGYAMLEPFLRVGVARMMNQPNASSLANPQTPIADAKTGQTQTLKSLLSRYGAEGKSVAEVDEGKKDGGGSASGRETDDGIVLPGDTLAKSLPVVLTSKLFTDAEVIPQPESFLTDKTFSVRLWLNREGRSRFYQWSRSHVNESIAFALDGQTLAAGRVTQPMDVNWWDVTNIRDEQAANTLVKWVKENVKQGR